MKVGGIRLPIRHHKMLKDGVGLVGSRRAGRGWDAWTGLPPAAFRSEGSLPVQAQGGVVDLATRFPSQPQRSTLIQASTQNPHRQADLGTLSPLATTPIQSRTRPNSQPPPYHHLCCTTNQALW